MPSDLDSSTFCYLDDLVRLFAKSKTELAKSGVSRGSLGAAPHRRQPGNHGESPLAPVGARPASGATRAFCHDPPATDGDT
jgi:hypothetical protein